MTTCVGGSAATTVPRTRVYITTASGSPTHSTSARSSPGIPLSSSRCSTNWSPITVSGKKRSSFRTGSSGNSTCATRWRNRSAARARRKTSAPRSTATCLATRRPSPPSRGSRNTEKSPTNFQPRPRRSAGSRRKRSGTRKRNFSRCALKVRESAPRPQRRSANSPTSASRSGLSHGISNCRNRAAVMRRRGHSFPTTRAFARRSGSRRRRGATRSSARMAPAPASGTAQSGLSRLLRRSPPSPTCSAITRNRR